MKLWNKIGTVLDAVTIGFLSYKACFYLWMGEDAIGALFVCATALWCISSKLHNIKLDNSTNLKEK